MSKVTRILYATTESIDRIESMCSVVGFIRADIWRRYGGLGTVGRSASDIRKEINAKKLYSNLPIDGTVRAETIKDIVNDIYTYKEAAKEKVRKEIHSRTKDNKERKRLYSLLKSDKYLQDSFLHRRMRFHFKHGKSHTDNQFIIRSDRHNHCVVDGQLQIQIKLNKQSGGILTLITNSNGKNVELNHRNLRMIHRNNKIEIHYSSNKTPTKKPCGKQTIGVDKGYSECFADSKGNFYGKDFGKVLTEYSDKTKQTGQARNKLYALSQKHLANGKLEKAKRIQENNLGTLKITHRRIQTRNKLKDADTNAALNILARLYDVEITRYMPYQQVKEILLKRSVGGTDRQGLELHPTTY